MNLNGKRLREARNDAGLSRAALSHKTGVSIETIKRAEGNQFKTTGENIAKLAFGLGVPIDSLFDAEPEPEKVA